MVNVRADTVVQACEFLETLKFSSHHCETPKLTEIVKIAIFSGLAIFDRFGRGCTCASFTFATF